MWVDYRGSLSTVHNDAWGDPLISCPYVHTLAAVQTHLPLNRCVSENVSDIVLNDLLYCDIGSRILSASGNATNHPTGWRSVWKVCQELWCVEKSLD